MAKGTTQDTTQKAKDVGNASTTQLQTSLSGGGAFGGPGLTKDYGTVQANADETRSAAVQGAKNIQTTGGYDPTQLAALRGNYGGATDFYKGMVNTGGYTDQDTNRFLNQATSGLQNTYQTLQQQAARQRAAQGGMGGDTTLAMARQLGNQVGSTTNDALAKIHEQVNANKFAGASGLGTTTTQQAGLESGVAQGTREGTQLMNQLYNVDTGRISEQGNMILKMMGIDTSNQKLSLDTLTQMAKQPGMLDNMLAIAGTAAKFVKPMEI